MKTVIFSDTHLTTTFDHKKFLFLKQITKDADRIVIAGDFWEGLLHSYNEFLASDWKKLLTILAQKNTIYVVGNHDDEITKTKKKLNFANVYYDKYMFKQGTKRYIVHHGHQYPLSFHKKFLGLIDLDTLGRASRSWINGYIVIESLLTQLFGTHVLQRTYRKFNKELKALIAPIRKENDIFIFGHTHSAEIDLENGFVNTGFVRHGLGQYVEITDENIELKQYWYKNRFWKLK